MFKLLKIITIKYLGEKIFQIHELINSYRIDSSIELENLNFNFIENT